MFSFMLRRCNVGERSHGYRVVIGVRGRSLDAVRRGKISSPCLETNGKRKNKGRNKVKKRHRHKATSNETYILMVPSNENEKWLTVGHPDIGCIQSEVRSNAETRKLIYAQFLFLLASHTIAAL